MELNQNSNKEVMKGVLWFKTLCEKQWCGVYIHPITDIEYHLQLELDYFDFNCKTVRWLNILRQNKTCRTDITGVNFKTIKSAIEYLENKILND